MVVVVVARVVLVVEMVVVMVVSRIAVMIIEVASGIDMDKRSGFGSSGIIATSRRSPRANPLCGLDTTQPSRTTPKCGCGTRKPIPSEQLPLRILGTYQDPESNPSVRLGH